MSVVVSSVLEAPPNNCKRRSRSATWSDGALGFSMAAAGLDSSSVEGRGLLIIIFIRFCYILLIIVAFEFVVLLILCFLCVSLLLVVSL